MSADRSAGVHIKAGVLYVAVVTRVRGELELLATKRIHPNSGLPDSIRLDDLAARVRQHLSPLHVSEIGILETRSFANWKYADAFSRVFAVCAVLAASTELGVPAVTHKTGEVGRAMSLKANELKTLESSAVNESTNPTYWTTGMAEAAAVAIYIAKMRG